MSLKLLFISKLLFDYVMLNYNENIYKLVKDILGL